MTEDFISEILAEVEEQENLQSEAYCDMVLIEIRELTKKIEKTFTTAEEEQTLIQNYALRRASKIQERIDFLARKLETFITETGEKTITLPNGILKVRKRQNKIEVVDMEKFLKHATEQMLNTVPEQVKPDIAGVKSWIKMTGGKIPPGVKMIEGQPEFSYTLNKETDNNGTKNKTGT